MPQRGDAPNSRSRVSRGSGYYPKVSEPAAEQSARRPVVLVIDDEPQVRSFLCQALADDYEVETAANGREALALMRELAPDLVVTDLRMPIMGGDEFITAVRSSADLCSTALMVISADSTEEKRVSLLRRGVEEYLVKPFSLDELRARISNLLERKREADALRLALADHERVALRERFLAHASEALGASGDPEQTLAAVSGLVLLAFGDVCELEIVQSAERPAYVGVTTRNAANLPACRIIERATRENGRGMLAWKAIAQDQAVLVGSMTAQDLEAIATDGEHLNALRELGPRSVMAVPLRVRGAVFGALAVASSSPSLCYEEESVEVVQGVADRVALALDQAYSLTRAQLALEERDTVLALITEGLRAPIDRVQKYLRLLRGGRQPERRTLEPVDGIQAAAAEMERLVSHLSTVKKAATDRLFVDRQPTDPAHLVLEAVGLSRPLVTKCRVELKSELRGELPQVWLDRSALLSAFTDLIENAARHTPPGGTIVVGAEQLERTVRLWVSDTGTGISAEELVHLFDAYATNRVTRGSGRRGLGLMSVRGIVQAHGGELKVRSTPGKGSTFSMLLPRDRVLV